MPPDALMRLAAVEHLKSVGAGGVVPSDDLKAGFIFEGLRVPLINPQRGIFKPAVIRSPGREFVECHSTQLRFEVIGRVKSGKELRNLYSHFILQKRRPVHPSRAVRP